MAEARERILRILRIYKIRPLRLLYILLLSLFIGSHGVPAKAAERSGRVLFISSYSYAWDTVQIQINGIRGGLGSDVVLDYEFMDTKRVNDEEALRLFYEGLAYRMEKVEPYDVVILGDDAALKFALEYREELFQDIPLVFEGVNSEELARKAVAEPAVAGVIWKAIRKWNIRRLIRHSLPRRI